MAVGRHNRLLAAGICLWLSAVSADRSHCAVGADPPAAESVVDFETRPLSPHFFPGKPSAMFGTAERLPAEARAQRPTTETQPDERVTPPTLQPRPSPHFFSGEIGLTSDEFVPEL